MSPKDVTLTKQQWDVLFHILNNIYGENITYRAPAAAWAIDGISREAFFKTVNTLRLISMNITEEACPQKM